MNLDKKFTDFITKENLFTDKDRLLIAVSGGMDSVVLCELCFEAGFDFIMAHCNFQLRGEESKRDEEFVLQLGRKYSKEVLVKQFSTEEYAYQNKVSIQVAARELRYSWFYDLLEWAPGARVPNPDFLLTAHHADDNIETLLMNFFKGTGISGLRAIVPKQGKIVRPLLFASKKELAAFAAEKGLTWVEDSSNAGEKYTRNYFRHQIIPQTSKVFPQAEKNLSANIERFREIELLYFQSIERHKKNLLEYKGNEVHIPVLKLGKVKPLPTIVYEIIKEYGFTDGQVTDVLALLESESGHFVASSTHRVIRNRSWLMICPLSSNEATNILIEEGITKVQTERWQLQISLKTGKGLPLDASKPNAQLDASGIKFPLLLRKWKAGDYFYPLGMRKKKKVARFFIDQKLSKTEKEEAWVVEMDKKIIWVVNQRIDDRFKITDKTTKVLEFTVSSP